MTSENMYTQTSHDYCPSLQIWMRLQGVNWRGRTALHCAAIADRPLSVFLLLLHGARKDVLSKDRKTAVEDADLRSNDRCKGPSHM